MEFEKFSARNEMLHPLEKVIDTVMSPTSFLVFLGFGQSSAVYVRSVNGMLVERSPESKFSAAKSSVSAENSFIGYITNKELIVLQ